MTQKTITLIVPDGYPTGEEFARDCGFKIAPLDLEQFLIDSAPDTLTRLGERLADLLDADHWNNIEPLLLDLAARFAEINAIVDPAICRLQFPDGSVPGNAKEAAEGWHHWYNSVSIFNDARRKHIDRLISPPTPDQEAYLRSIQEQSDAPVDMTYVVGGPGETPEQRTKRERNNLHDYTSNLVGLLQLLKCRDDIPAEVKDIMNTYPCVVDAAAYLTQIVPPDRKCPVCGVGLTVFDTAPCDTANCPITA